MGAPFSSSKEKFLIVDVGRHGASALFLDFDERRELVFKRFAANLDLKKFLAAQAGSIFQKSWEGNYFFNSRRRLVVLADSSLATTIPVPLDFIRDAALVKTPVTVNEAGDWFARATAKIFTKCRLEASRRLGTGDIETVLVNQRIERVTIDSRSVTDPIGHSGKRISFIIEFTFANRELVETLTPFFNAPGEFFFAEAAQARLAVLARVRPLPINMVTIRDGGRSSLFVFQKAEHGCPVVYREPFPWDSAAMVRTVAADFSVGPALAEEMYGMYVRGEVSDAAGKHFNALVAPLTERFLQALGKANLHGPVYLDVPRDLPLKIPHRLGNAMIENIPVGLLLEKFGFSAGAATMPAPLVVLRYLAPFFELYFDNNRSEFNELLRRKLHWLG